jgi:hypothetical protein
MEPISKRYKDRNPQAISGETFDDDCYLPDHELLQVLRSENPKKQIDDGFCGRWRNRKSVLRPDEPALRFDRAFSTDATRTRTEQYIHRLGDARAIIEGRENKHPTDKRAREIIQEAVVNSETGLESADFNKVLGDNRITSAQRRSAIVALKLRIVRVGTRNTRKCYYCLPGQSRPNHEDLNHAPKLRKAVGLLRQVLPDGEWVDKARVMTRARQTGIKRSKVYAAKDHLGVVSRLSGPTAEWMRKERKEKRPAQLKGQAAEKSRDGEPLVKDRTSAKDDDGIKDMLRNAIKLLGRNANPKKILGAVTVRRKAGLAALRELQALGEYSGFVRAQRS